MDMRILAALSMVVSLAYAEEFPRGKTETTKFEATVKAVQFFQEFSGSVKVLHREPRFVITVQRGDEKPVHYAIHSIAQMFGPEDMKTLQGKKFQFSETIEFNVEGRRLRTTLAIERDVKK